MYGHTDINAQTANGGLAVAENDEGTLTVFRYPSPSYYDQVKYNTEVESEGGEDHGVAPNEGMFLGLVVQEAGSDDPSTTWLRDWDADQTYQEGRTDVVETTYQNTDLGLTVVVRDVAAAPPTDVLARDVTVIRDQTSSVTDVSLVSYENLNLVVSKYPHFPTQDWCQEEENRDAAAYRSGADAVVHRKAGIDRSTGQHQSVAVAMGFDGASSEHQVGGDAYEPSAAPVGQLQGPVQDAYEDAADGTLQGNDRYVGQTTGAMTQDLTFTGIGNGMATGTVYFAGGSNPTEALASLDDARDQGFDALADGKEAWLEDLLEDAPRPDVPEDQAGEEAIETLADRAVVTLVTNTDRRSKAIVASIATQSPYGEDWPRDGAYFNHALEVMGLQDWVRQHNDFYVEVQSKADQVDETQSAVVPPGNWAMNYYADGVPGGPIPWEIDETAYGVWIFWDHYRATGDVGYLEDVYPALKRAADFLVECEDPRNGLQCRAIEDDNPGPAQTIVGASTVELALRSAAQAAETLDKPQDTARYQQRADELAHAIDSNLWDGEKETYGPSHDGHAETAWPVCFDPTVTNDEERFSKHLDYVWKDMADTFRNESDRGLYESKGLLALAKHEKGEPRMEDVRKGLHWVATEHATNDTQVMGEVWIQEDDDIKSAVSQPHTWEQILFYMAALETWTPDDVDAEAGCGGALQEIIDEQTDGGDGIEAGPTVTLRGLPVAP
jgi:hypothetical protein